MITGFEEIYDKICAEEMDISQKVFDALPADIPWIKCMKRFIPKLPDMSRFTNIDALILAACQMTELHPSIGSLDKLVMLVLSENRISILPKEIGQLKNLMFINLKGNPITEIPEEIKYLDKTNGGSLGRIAVDPNDIGEENYKKLKELLPTVIL